MKRSSTGGGDGGGGGAVDARTWAAHVLAVAATTLVLVWCIHFRGGLALRSHNKQLIFNVHPVLMVIGVIVIGGEAILSYRSLPVSRGARKKAHLALHAVGLSAGILGVYAVFKFHEESGIPNLYTLHSWIGITTISLYALQWLAGFLAFFFPGAAPATRRSVVPWHAVLGLLVFALAVGNAQLGFLEKLTFLQGPPAMLNKYGAEALLVNFTAVVVLLLGVAAVLATVNVDGSSACPEIITEFLEKKGEEKKQKRRARPKKSAQAAVKDVDAQLQELLLGIELESGTFPPLANRPQAADAQCVACGKDTVDLSAPSPPPRVCKIGKPQKFIGSMTAAVNGIDLKCQSLLTGMMEPQSRTQSNDAQNSTPDDSLIDLSSPLPPAADSPRSLEGLPLYDEAERRALSDRYKQFP